MSEENKNRNEVTLFDNIQNPIEAIEKMGQWISKSGLFSCDKLEQGMVLAMASLSERRPITDICRRYHIVKGKLSMKAEAMLAEFNQRGGKHVWVKSDDKQAVLRLTYDQFDKFEVAFTIKDAERAGLCGADGTMNKGQNGPGSWQKMPDAMLRARVTSKAIRMVCPEIVAGVYTPEEVNDDIRPTVHAEARSLLAPAQAPVSPQAAIEPEVMPPEAVDTPANSTAIEAEVVPPEDKEASERKELIELLEEVGPDGAEWLVAKKWVKNAEEIEALPIQKVRDLIGRKSQFKQAVKTFKELQKKEKKNV